MTHTGLRFTLSVLVMVSVCLSSPGMRSYALAPRSSFSQDSDNSAEALTDRFSGYLTFPWQLTWERRMALMLLEEHSLDSTSILLLLESSDFIVREAGTHLLRQWGVNEQFRPRALHIIHEILLGDESISAEQAVQPALALTRMAHLGYPGAMDLVRSIVQGKNINNLIAIAFALGQERQAWTVELLEDIYHNNLGVPFTYAVKSLEYLEEGRAFLAQEEQSNTNKENRIRLARSWTTARDELKDLRREVLEATRGVLREGGESSFLGEALPAFSTPYRRALRDRFLKIEEIAAILAKEFDESFVGINIFGSTTRGYFVPDSDLDFSIFVNDVDRNQADAILNRFQELLHQRGISSETKLPPFQDISDHLVHDPFDLVGEVPFAMPQEAEEFFDSPGMVNPHVLFSRDYFNFFKGMFFGDRDALRKEQRKILDAHTPGQWEKIRGRLAEAEQYISIAFHRFGIQEIDEQEKIRIIAGLKRVPPPYEDMGGVLSSGGGASVEERLLNNPWINIVISRRELPEGRQWIRQALRLFLSPNHPLKEAIFEQVDSLSEEAILEELDGLLRTVPSEENNRAGVAFHNRSDYLGRPLTVRELFLHPSQGTSDEGQLLTSLISPGILDTATMEKLFGAQAEESRRRRYETLIRAGYLLIKALEILSRKEDLVLIQANDIALNESISGGEPGGELTHYLTRSEGVFRDGEFWANEPKNLLALADLMIPVDSLAKRISLGNLFRLIGILGEADGRWHKALEMAENRLRIEEIERELALGQEAYPRVEVGEGRSLYYAQKALDGLETLDKWVRHYGQPTEVAAMGVSREIDDHEDELVEVVLPRMDRILTLDYSGKNETLNALMGALVDPLSLELSADSHSLFLRVVAPGEGMKQDRIEVRRSDWPLVRPVLLKMMSEEVPSEDYGQARARFYGRFSALDTDWDVIASQESVVASQRYEQRVLARAEAIKGKVGYSVHHHPRTKDPLSTVDRLEDFGERESHHAKALQISASDIGAELGRTPPLDWAEIRILGTAQVGLASHERVSSRIYNMRDVGRWAVALRDSILALLAMRDDIAPEQVYVQAERLKGIANKLQERGYLINQFVEYALGKNDYRELREIYSRDPLNIERSLRFGSIKDFLFWQLLGPKNRDVVEGLNSISLALLRAQQQGRILKLFSRIMVLYEKEPRMRDRIQEDLRKYGLTQITIETDVAKVLEAGVRLKELFETLDPDGSLATRYEEEIENDFWEGLIAEEDAARSL